MSVCGQNGQTEDENASEDVVAPARDLYKQKPVSKVVRVLTVLAYLLSVSLAAILLSVYYVCVWKSPELPPLNATAKLNAQRGSLHDYTAAVFMENNNFTGGGHTSVSDIITEPSTSNNGTVFTNATTDTSVVDNSTYDSTVTPTTNQDTQPINILDDIGAFNKTDTVT